MKKNECIFYEEIVPTTRERERDHSWEVKRKIDWIEKVQETLFLLLIQAYNNTQCHMGLPITL